MSNRPKRSMLLLALLCLAAVGLAACGGSGDSSGTASTAEPAEVSGTVEVWDLAAGSFPEYDRVSKQLQAEFEREYPKVTIKTVPKPFGSFEPLYRAAFAAREVPDVMMMAGGEAGVFTFQQGLEPLNDLIPAEMGDQITNWSTVTPGFSEEGERYGVPIGASGQIFYYNKDLFAKAGLPREFAPETWDEVKEAGEALKAAGIQPFAGGAEEGIENMWWFEVAWQSLNTEEQAVELSEGEMPFTDEAVTRAMEPELMMQEAGLFPSDRYSTPYFPDGHTGFAEGKGAMIIGLRSLIAYYGEFNAGLGVENVGMFLPPGSSYLGTEPEWVWTMPKGAQNKDAAWAFIDFMGSREGIGRYVEKGVLLPNRDDVPLPANAPPQAGQLVEWAQELNLFPELGIVVPHAVGQEMNVELNEVLQGRASLEEVQESMQETAERAGG